MYIQGASSLFSIGVLICCYFTSSKWRWNPSYNIIQEIPCSETFQIMLLLACLRLYTFVYKINPCKSIEEYTSQHFIGNIHIEASKEEWVNSKNYCGASMITKDTILVSVQFWELTHFSKKVSIYSFIVNYQNEFIVCLIFLKTFRFIEIYILKT